MYELPGGPPDPDAPVDASQGLFARLGRLVVGKPKDPTDPNVFHKLSLVAFLAWVGLGADGLSSSAYGPDEAFRAILGHEYLALFLAALTTLTVVLLSYSYTFVVEHFPSGGGGYVVASKLLGPLSRASSPAPPWWWTTSSRSRSRSPRGSMRS